MSTTSTYSCPTCGGHPVTVTSEGFSATEVKVSRCEQAPEWVVATYAPASAPLAWTPWAA